MAFMHELGHTNYLHHAAQSGCEYCDYTCAMGGCCDTRCFNPVHNWQLGWGKPMAVLNSDTLPTGVWSEFDLPLQQVHARDMVVSIEQCC